MDERLTPAHLEALVPSFYETTLSEVAPSEALGRALWALLCMHVGGQIPPSAKAAAFEAFGPRGYWANIQARQKIAAVIFEELKLYQPGITGRVRFPFELHWKMLEKGGSRYYGSVAFRPVNEWEVWVQHECHELEPYREDKDAHKRFPRCLGCGLVRYCGKDCQLKDWPDHKTICKSVGKK